MEPNGKSIRPTKKQQETLVFIEKFIVEHGYSPSYREIMQGCNYNSVATVALHVNNLIKRGHLEKRDKSARSLEVVKQVEKPSLQISNVSEKEEKWLVKKIDYFFSKTEQNGTIEVHELDGLYVLIGALKVLGLDGAAQSFMPRLSELKKRVK
jgi:SOS-response transcriptional repressor LexA